MDDFFDISHTYISGVRVMRTGNQNGGICDGLPVAGGRHLFLYEWNFTGLFREISNHLFRSEIKIVYSDM